MPDPTQPPIRPVEDRRKNPPTRRRSSRAEMKVPLIVKLITKDGTVQEENTQTKIVNAHGCMVMLKTRVVEGQLAEMVNLETKQVHINLNEQPIGWY